jgi:hypothetical protein
MLEFYMNYCYMEVEKKCLKMQVSFSHGAEGICDAGGGSRVLGTTQGAGLRAGSFFVKFK